MLHRGLGITKGSQQPTWNMEHGTRNFPKHPTLYPSPSQNSSYRFLAMLLNSAVNVTTDKDTVYPFELGPPPK
ncbi:hypothetical protein ACLKA7_006486 [Drosophila subpalustris]